ncbi:hypothetical protein LXL04_005057 [Taraxacum kok-saghyz]
MVIWNRRSRFSKEPNLQEKYGVTYEYGAIDYYDYVDMDVFSIHELADMVRELDNYHSEPISFHFHIPGTQLDIGLLPLVTDGDVHVMSGFVKENKLLDIYVEHRQSTVNRILQDDIESDFGQTDSDDNESEDGNDLLYAKNNILDEPEVDMSNFISVLDYEVERDPNIISIPNSFYDDELDVIDTQVLDFIVAVGDKKQELLKNLAKPVICSQRSPSTSIQTCREIKACIAEFMGKNLIGQVERNPTIPIRALHAKKYEVGFSRMKAFRAKQIAQKHVFGDFQKQYALLWDYGLKLKRTNVGTTFKVDVYSEPNVNSQTRMSKRVYVCLGPLKLGFKADSWTWFLDCLAEDLDLNASSNFTFISDRQKGLSNAISKIFPNAQHRVCLKHIHENMRRNWRDTEYKNLLWETATTTTTPHFDNAMELYRQFDVEA